MPQHDHHHHDGHTHGAGHDEVDSSTAAVLDASVPDSDLSPAELSRRSLFRAAGILGGAATVGMVGAQPAAAAPAAAPARQPGRGRVNEWLAGDHHIHTQYSPDGLYRVIDQVQHGRGYGLDWMVITDHGSEQHVRIGVERVNPDIVRARDQLPGTLVFQGLEWNIPAAEHGTVFVAPGRNEVAVLKQFETDFDGAVRGASANTPQNEALAVAGVQWLGRQVAERRVDSALFLANHPSRQGIDSPHEIRAWRDADPTVAIGFEGAPGHQAASLPRTGSNGERLGQGDARGYYSRTPSANSFAAYPPESYRTWGGFDWMTATVGGLWDSLLAEGRPWSITANSDSHSNWGDTARRGGPDTDFAAQGFYTDPVYSGAVNLDAGDFWPGFYSRTHVGVARRGYLEVMQGLRDGRVWVDHGRLVESVDVRVRRAGTREPGTTLGGTVEVRRGTRMELVVTVVPQTRPNWAQFVPRLNRVDLVRGTVDPAPLADRDSFRAPDTRVVRQWDTSTEQESFELVQDLGPVEAPFYVRVRGTDANQSAPGFLGAAIDPAGPAIDVAGTDDPWLDLWFYTNPIWVLPRR